MTRAATSTLSYAVRPRVLVKYLGQLALMLAVLSLVPLAVSLYTGGLVDSWRYGAIVAALVVAGVPASRVAAPGRIQVNEALAIAALAFAVSPLVMAFPLAGAGLPWLDAWFEAVSAVTTTGLSTLASVEDKSPGFLFARAWMQWYGGLGIVILSVALLMGHQVAARRLAEPASSETFVTTARTHARRMLVVYAILTATAVVVVWMLLGDGFTSLLHVMTAVSTAGFSSFDDSLAGLPHWRVRYALILLALCGAIPLPLYYRAWRHGWRSVLADVELRALILAIAMTCALLLAFAVVQPGSDWSSALPHVLLTGISAQTSTGFSSMSVAELEGPSKIVLMGAMTIGGGIGSTAGGVKILRLVILLRLIQLTIQRTAMPTHAVLTPHLGGKPLEPDDLLRALMLIALFAMVVLASWLVFVAFGHAPLDALFEVISATGTVGLSTGIAAPELHPVLKVVLCADMLLGRVEIVALLIVLYPRTWFGRRDTAL